MPNQLIHESSPYLLQHAYNPVEWYPWGEEALSKARKENKLILVSIGYAACHWCHVMEHESFEDEEVAQLMNRYFINIKVDREERPDIDKIYMDAVQLMSGRGGWPLNCIALPDGRPIFGGTYFPKANWMQILAQLAQLYRDEPERAASSAENIVAYMQQMEQVSKILMDTSFERAELRSILDTWMEEVDFKWGGRKVSGNKFPLPMNLLFLLRAGFYSGDERALQAAHLTLEKMAFGGIYDHLAGGFARYAVDPYWKVPHFEKMLYDNAQLVSVYAEAYQLSPHPLYQSVVYKTLDFVENLLTAAEGGFYSSLDADSEGQEGKFYVWRYEEIEELLGEDAKLFADYYNVHPFGNWEHSNILFVLESEEDFAERWKLDPIHFSEKLRQGREVLGKARAQRIHPALDDKILCSWNALMLKAYADAYRVFGEERFLDSALRNAAFISSKMIDQGKLYRVYKEDKASPGNEANGKRSVGAFLDDYAYLIEAYLTLYQLIFDERWLWEAETLMKQVLAQFYDEQSGMFYYTSQEDPVLIKRMIELNDDVVPSPNAVMANNLFMMGCILDKAEYREQAEQMLQNVRESLIKSPSWHGYWAQLLLKYVYPHFEVAICGPTARRSRMEMESLYYPNKIYTGSESPSELPLLRERWREIDTFFICEGNTCDLPVQSVMAAQAQLMSAAERNLNDDRP